MTVLTYKGFAAQIEFDADDMILTGKLAGITDAIGFHGDTGPEVVEAFHEAVDDYLETCAKIGKKPQKPYSGKVMLRMDPAVHAQAALAASLSGKSMNAWGEEVIRAASEAVVRSGVLTTAS